MVNKQDRRVERTKRDLKESLFILMEEKGNINSITVSDIAEKANYNRATFYGHYSDKESILNEITIEAIIGFIEAIRLPYNESRIIDIQQLSSDAIKIFNFVEMNPKKFSLLFNNYLFPGFQQELGNAIKEEFFNKLHFLGDSFKKLDKELYCRVKAYSIIAMIDFWIENDFSVSSQYMAEQLILIENYPSKSKNI